MMQDVKAILLVGGLGTRLRTVLPGTPKPLASLGDQTFLELLICQLRHQGIRELVLSTGYLAEQIAQEFGNGEKLGVRIEYSEESEPLGTGGAVRFAQRHVGKCSSFVAMNGDSFLETNFHELIDFHRQHAGLGTIAVRQVEDASRYGTVCVNSEDRITGFLEKTGYQGPGLINAGVYVFEAGIFAHIPEGQVSLEREVFPKVLDRGLYAMEQRGMFIDIGTPQDYARARSLCAQLRNAAFR